MKTHSNPDDKPVSFHKTVQKREEFFVQFTPEECEALGFKEGDKFEILEDGGGLLLKKFKNLDLDLAEFDRTTLEFLVSESCRTHKPVDEVLADIITQTLKEKEDELEHIRKTKKALKNSDPTAPKPLDKPENL